MRAALLLADPDPHEPGYLSRNLSSDGFDVVEAGWSAQALDIAERSRPDIVLAAEPELCARLREGEPGRRWDRNVPVIVLTTADADPIERVRAFERGADDVAEREISRVLARIQAVLRRATPGRPRCSRRASSLSTGARARCAWAACRCRSPAGSSTSPSSSQPIRIACSRRTSSCETSGLRRPLGHPHRRLARLAAAQQAPRRGRRAAVRRQRVGAGLPAARVALHVVALRMPVTTM